VAVVLKHVEAVANVCKGSTDQPPLIEIAAGARDFQQTHDAGINGTALWMAQQQNSQGLQLTFSRGSEGRPGGTQGS
jgi:hypothetical protein